MCNSLREANSSVCDFIRAVNLRRLSHWQEWSSICVQAEGLAVRDTELPSRSVHHGSFHVKS
jgi:hypothetical protein